MSQTVTAVPVAGATPAFPATTNHTVGIEPYDRDLWGFHLTTPQPAVVERYNGVVITVVTTERDPFRTEPLDVVAKDYAATRLATLVEANWPDCAHCGWPGDICDDPAGHSTLAAGNESTWLR